MPVRVPRQPNCSLGTARATRAGSKGEQTTDTATWTTDLILGVAAISKRTGSNSQRRSPSSKGTRPNRRRHPGECERAGSPPQGLRTSSLAIVYASITETLALTREQACAVNDAWECMPLCRRSGSSNAVKTDRRPCLRRPESYRPKVQRRDRPLAGPARTRIATACLTSRAATTPPGSTWGRHLTQYER
jgi:hypothetical protein